MLFSAFWCSGKSCLWNWEPISLKEVWFYLFCLIQIMFLQYTTSTLTIGYSLSTGYYVSSSKWILRCLTILLFMLFIFSDFSAFELCAKLLIFSNSVEYILEIIYNQVPICLSYLLVPNTYWSCICHLARKQWPGPEAI